MKKVCVIFAAAGLLTAGACTKVGGDPDAVVALSFDELPFPAIVAGDSLRDEAGTPLKLAAIAYNSDGEVIADAPINFLSLDVGGAVSDGFVVAGTGTATSFRVIAQSGALQSRPLTVIITPRPDSIAQEGTVDTIRYRVLEEATQVSQGVNVRLFSTSVDPPVPARGWIVHYEIEYHGAPEASATSQRAWLVDDGNRRSDVDTADTEGRASRRLRISPTGGIAEIDSVVVIASATHRGSPLKGSPVRVTVQVVAQGAAGRGTSR